MLVKKALTMRRQRRAISSEGTARQFVGGERPIWSLVENEGVCIRRGFQKVTRERKICGNHGLIPKAPGYVLESVAVLKRLLELGEDCRVRVRLR